MGEVKTIIPESVLKKRKREEEWALAKKTELEAAKKKNAENRKLIFKRAKQYAEEYANKDREVITLKRDAKLKGGFYVEPEAKLLFIIRIRGINAIDPKNKENLAAVAFKKVDAELHVPHGRDRFIIPSNTAFFILEGEWHSQEIEGDFYN